MNKTFMNTVSLAKDPFIRKGEGGGGGGVTINNQEKSLEITENGVTEVTADSGFTGLSKVIVNTNVASSGGGALVSKPVNDVNFYDYDGTILHSYTKDEFLALSAMPPLPEMEGLICQEWNWGYEEAQEYVAEYGLCDIGATYITDDGKTRLYIRIPENGRLYQKFRMTCPSYARVDWGDGSTGIINSDLIHTYESPGEYVITIDPEDGNITYFRTEVSSLVKVEVGRGVQGSSEFAVVGEDVESISLPKDFAPATFRYNNSGLKCLVLPRSTNTLALNCLGGAYNLKHVCLPNTPILFKNEGISSEKMRRLVIPKGVQFSNVSSALKNCLALNYLILPKEVTGVPSINSSSSEFTYLEVNNGDNVISNTVIYNTSYLKAINFGKCKSIPDLQNSTVFRYLPTNAKIIVPDALYDEWIAATNWSSLASYIIKKSDWDAQS